MKQFLFKSTILTILVFILGAIGYFTIFKQYYLPILPLTVLFFYLVTNSVHAYMLRIARIPSSKFTFQYLAIRFLKMFFYLAVAIVFVIFNKEIAKQFIVNYLLLYVVYTVFEVSEFSKVVRSINK